MKSQPVSAQNNISVLVLAACAAGWLFCSNCFAQIELTYTAAKSLVGATAPEIIGDRIIIGDDSKPQISAVAIIKVASSEKVRLKARKSLRESAELVKLSEVTDEKSKITTAKYMLAGEGSYLVEAMTVSWDRSIDVEVGKSPQPVDPVVPQPVNPVDPIKPIDPPIPDPSLSQVSKEVRAAVVAYSQKVATDYETLATETKAGKYKTVMESGAVAQSKDELARNEFKKSMATIMAPKLGNSQLPTNAPLVFQEIANGFRSVK